MFYEKKFRIQQPNTYVCYKHKIDNHLRPSVQVRTRICTSVHSAPFRDTGVVRFGPWDQEIVEAGVSTSEPLLPGQRDHLMSSSASLSNNI